MRQAPNYLLIGNGRVSQHFQYYFHLLNLPFHVWHRTQPLDLLADLTKKATHALLLIHDKAIEEFSEHYLPQEHLIKVHFSGSLISQSIQGAHPLMTFNDGLYSLEQYQQIPFILDEDALDFNTLLPGLKNPSAHLNKSQKAKYHALCVLSTNFSCMLWQKLFVSLKQDFNLSPDAAFPILKQQTSNLIHDYSTALTGPLVRNDHETIANNINALTNDEFQSIYKEFVACYQRLQEKIK